MLRREGGAIASVVSEVAVTSIDSEYIHVEVSHVLPTFNKRRVSKVCSLELDLAISGQPKSYDRASYKRYESVLRQKMFSENIFSSSGIYRRRTIVQPVSIYTHYNASLLM